MFNKKKVSIDFTEPEYKILSSFAKGSGQSNSFVVNTLVNLFLRISPDVSKSIGAFCFKKYQEERNSVDLLSGYERDSAVTRAAHYKKISEFFGFPEESASLQMRKTYLKNGYVTYPCDWIILHNIFGDPESCMYAGCVESRNSEKYGIPHFIFFCNKKYSSEYDSDMEEQIFSACEKAYPNFRKLYNLQVELQYDTPEDRGFPSKARNLDEWKAAPHFSLFHVVEKGDPYYWNESSPDYEPPFGAIIIRKE